MYILASLNSFLWGGPLLVLLMGTHLYYSWHLHFPQRRLLKAIRLSVTPDGGRISAFAALSTTLAATLGTGNIIGVSTAVALGGPGAVFWCWLTGLFGMATSYAECYLSVLYKEKKTDGYCVGGPMYVLEKGVHNKFLAKFYAACVVIAAFGVGCTTQANSLAQAMKQTFGFSPLLVGAAAAIIAGLVLIGGVSSISRVCTKIVPILGILYIGSCLILLAMNHAYLGDTVRVIFSCALSPKAAFAGAAGGSLSSAIRFGIARGLYTNEAGIGSAAIAAASSDTSSPAYQAAVSMTAVFWDTVVMCLLTGLVIIANALADPASLADINETGWTAAAFRALPGNGEAFLSLSLAAFAIITLIGWYYFGEKGMEYLFGETSIPHYKLCYIVMIFVGALIPLGLVWECTDLCNAVMVFPNVFALWVLRKQIPPPA